VRRVFRNVWLWLERAAAKRDSYERRAAAVKLVELDARTLQDIGLEPWRSPLGARIALRRYEMRRWSASRLGLY
jgi:hypothetical protein